MKCPVGLHAEMYTRVNPYHPTRVQVNWFCTCVRQAALGRCVDPYSISYSLLIDATRYAAYTGPLYAVRRRSDNATTDIHAVSPGGVADAAAQDAYCNAAAQGEGAH